MSTLPTSVCPIIERVRVSDLLGPDIYTEDFSWEVRRELLRVAREKGPRLPDYSQAAIRARGIGPDEHLVATVDEIPY